MADLSLFLSDEIAGGIAASTGVPDPVPEGDYDLQLSESDVNQTKDGTGVLLKCTFEVITGEYEGRKVFTQFNVANKSAQAQQIGIAEFKALCLGCGVPFEEARNDTSLLEFKPFKAKVGLRQEIDKATGKAKVNPATNAPYPPRNSIKKFYVHGEVPTPAATATAGVPAAHVAAQAGASKPAASAAAKARPWEK